MKIQLEFDFFDQEKHKQQRAQKIFDNIPPPEEPFLLTDIMRIKEKPQERYHEWLKRTLELLKND
jgi:hypothetical protein|tara:strand:+ start:164 stop:358 length:195 start_codon:yes stop_codon:yes gene_type:complete